MNNYDEDYEDEVRIAENMFHAEHYCFDKCPYCDQLLWEEWGFYNPLECMFQEWINYAYPIPLYSSDDNYNIQEISEIEDEVII